MPATMTVVVNANTVPTFTALGPYCQNSTPGILPTTSLNGVNGTWNSPISTANVGSTTYTFTPSDLGCYSFATMTVMVESLVEPAFSEIGVLCYGAIPPDLANVSPSGIVGSWYPPQIDNALSADYIFAPQVGQCSNGQQIHVEVEPLPVIDFVGENRMGCQPLTLEIECLTSSAFNYFWQFGDGSSSSLQNPIHTYQESGVFDVSLMVVSNNGCSSSVSYPAYVEVFQKPQAYFENITDQVEGSSSALIQFQDQSVHAYTWNWSFGDDNAGFSTEQNPVYFFEEAGDYLVCLNVSSDHGCQDEYCKKIDVEAFASIYIPNSFSPNNDGVNDVFIPKGVGLEIDEYVLMIFNRWGEQIFRSTDVNIGWDGRCKGRVIEDSDVFTYRLLVRQNNGVLKDFYGKVTLLK